MTSVKKNPRFIELTAEKEKLIDELLAKVEAAYNPLPKQLINLKCLEEGKEAPKSTTHNSTRMYCYSFLNSRQWDVEKAFEMVKDVVKYREQYNLDDSPVIPPAVSTRGLDEEFVKTLPFAKEARPKGRADRVIQAVDNNVHCGLHYYDKWGQPVLYIMLGTIDEPGLLKDLKSIANVGQNTADVFFEFIRHAFSVGELMALDQQHKYDTGVLESEGTDASEGLIRNVTVVVDCKGFGYGLLWKPALDLFIESMKRLFKYYPDCVHRILVVNCPTMIMFAFNIVKGVFDENFRRKFNFLYPDDSAAGLLAVIDKKRLPAFLGGECACEGGCISGYDRANPKKDKKNKKDNASDVADEGDVRTENIAIKAGKAFDKQYPMKAGDEVIWEFLSTSGHDIKFRVYLVPEAKLGEADLKHLSEKSLLPFLVSEDSPSEGSDHYIAKENGTLVLVWSNKASWFTGKNIQMKVFLQKATVLEEGDAAASTN